MPGDSTVPVGVHFGSDAPLDVDLFHAHPFADTPSGDSAPADDVVIAHDPSATYRYLTSGSITIQGTTFFAASGAGGPGFLSAPRGTGGAGAPAGAPPSGDPPPPDEDAIAWMWMKDLGIDTDRRIKQLSSVERIELARIASRNRGYALGLVRNEALKDVTIPGLREIDSSRTDRSNSDQLGLVLTILDRLEHMGVSNNGAYFTTDKLLSVKGYELAGIITEMGYLAVVAEKAAANGMRTKASERTTVTWDDVSKAFLSQLLKRLPKIKDDELKRMLASAEIDGIVFGDRIVEVKLRGTGKTAFSRADAGDDWRYVRDQLQAIKLMAIARRDVLRGVEFAIFAEDVDENWVRMVTKASEEMKVGVHVVLHVPGGFVSEPVNTMPPVERRQVQVTVSVPRLSPPPQRRSVTKQEEKWGVGEDAVEFMLGFIQGQRDVRQAAARSPHGFYQNIRPAHAKMIMDGYKATIEEHFSKLDPKGKDKAQQAARKEWLDAWGVLNAQVTRHGERQSTTTAIAMAEMADKIQVLVKKGEEDLFAAIEAKRRFLGTALSRISIANGELSHLSKLLLKEDYRLGPSLLWRLDRVRDTLIKTELADMLRAEGLDDLADLSLEELANEVDTWKDQRILAGDVHRFTQELSSFIIQWRSVIDDIRPKTLERWRQEVADMQALAPPTGPLSKRAALEFLKRFAQMSSKGAIGPGKGHGPARQDAGNWKEAVANLGLDGSGLNPPFGEEVAAAVSFMPDDVKLFPAEADRIRYALQIELFHVPEKDATKFYYLPNMNKAALRMIRAVLLTALLRHRAGTTLGLGRHLIFPWVIGSGQHGQQPFWLEVNAAGRPDQLVLERVVVIERSQITPRAVKEFLQSGVTLQLPRESGGVRTVHFDLIPPATGDVPVDVFVQPPKTEVDVDAIAQELIHASFRDRYPEGRHINGQSQFEPVEDGFLTVPEIEQLGLEDAYLKRSWRKSKAMAFKAKAEAEAKAEEEGHRFIDAGMIRRWPEFIKQYLDMQRRSGRTDVKDPSYYYLHVRTSHRGATRVLLHLEHILEDFGEIMRIRAIPGFELATEIAPPVVIKIGKDGQKEVITVEPGKIKPSQRDAYDVPWTHFRLVNLFNAIQGAEDIPAWEKRLYIRRFRATSGGSRFESLEPGQIALNFQALRKSEWGVYFRVFRPAGFYTRQDLLNRGLSMRGAALIVEFIERNIPPDHQRKYMQYVRSAIGRNEVILNLPGLAQAYADRLGDLLPEITRIFPRALNPEAWKSMLERAMPELGRRIEALPQSERAGLLHDWQRIRTELARELAKKEPNLTPLTRRVFILEIDVRNAERRQFAREMNPGGGTGAGGAGSAPAPGSAPSGGTPAPSTPPVSGPTQRSAPQSTEEAIAQPSEETGTAPVSRITGYQASPEVGADVQAPGTLQVPQTMFAGAATMMFPSAPMARPPTPFVSPFTMTRVAPQLQAAL